MIWGQQKIRASLNSERSESLIKVSIREIELLKYITIEEIVDL